MTDNFSDKHTIGDNMTLGERGKKMTDYID